MSEPTSAGKKQIPEEHRVPLWLAVLVGVLAVAVLGLGIYVYQVGRPSSGSGEQALADRRVADAKAQLRASDGSAAARLNLAYAYQRAGNYGAARREYRAVLRRDPNNTAAEYNLGVIDEVAKDTKSASAHYKRCLAVDPGNELAAKNLSLILYANEDWKGMVGIIEPAISTNPDLSDLRYLLGVAYEKTGQREKAIKQYETALEFYPNLREAKDALARLQ